MYQPRREDCVTGAGDTAIGSLSPAAINGSLDCVVVFANEFAAVAVEKIGTAIITWTETNPRADQRKQVVTSIRFFAFLDTVLRIESSSSVVLQVDFRVGFSTGPCECLRRFLGSALKALGWIAQVHQFSFDEDHGQISVQGFRKKTPWRIVREGNAFLVPVI
jgi:hypothetical protein